MSTAMINSNKDQYKYKEIMKNMCDKITHLTRVVFMLNSKQGESEAMLASIISSYEKELSTIVRESNSALNILKAKVKELTQLNDNYSNNNLQSIELQYSSSLNSYIAKYKQFKTEAKSRIALLQQEFEEKSKQMTNELSSMRNTNDCRLKEMQKKCDEDKKFLIESKAKETSRLNQEIVNLKKENDKRIEIIDSECKSQIEKCKSEASKIKSENEEVIKEFNEKISSYKTQIAINESNINIANSQLANANNEICYFKEKEKEKNDKIKQCETALNDQRTTSKSKLKELTDEIEDYKFQLKNYHQLQHALELKEALIAQFDNEKKNGLIREREFRNEIDALNQRVALIQLKQNETEAKNSSIIKANEDLNTQIAELNQKLSSNTDNDTKYKIQIETLKSDIITKEKQLTKQYDAYIFNLKKTALEDKKESEEQRRTLQNEHQSTIKALNDTIALLKETIRKNEEKLKLINEQKSEMKESNEKEVNELKEAHSNQIEELKSKLNKNSNSMLEKSNMQLKALQKTQLDEMASLESRHREEIDRNAFQNSLNMNELQLKLDSQISVLKIENIQLREKVIDIDTEKQEMINSINNNNSKLKRIASGYPPKKISELENTISSLRKELLIRESEREKKKEEFKMMQQDLFNKMKKEFSDAMNILQEKNRTLLNEMSELEILIKCKENRKDNHDGINKSSVDEGSKIDLVQLKRNGSDYNTNMNFFVNNSGMASLNKKGIIMGGMGKQLKIKPISNKSLSKKT